MFDLESRHFLDAAGYHVWCIKTLIKIFCFGGYWIQEVEPQSTTYAKSYNPKLFFHIRHLHSKFSAKLDDKCSTKEYGHSFFNFRQVDTDLHCTVPKQILIYGTSQQVWWPWPWKHSNTACTYQVWWKLDKNYLNKKADTILTCSAPVTLIALAPNTIPSKELS